MCEGLRADCIAAPTQEVVVWGFGGMALTPLKHRGKYWEENICLSYVYH